MGKLIVPQELQEQIIDLYINKGYGRAKIKKLLNLPFGDSIIVKILKNNNIHIRNYHEAKVGCYKMEVDRKIQNQIIELYAKGYGLEKIVIELNLPFSFDKVKSILKDNNIHIRNVKESAQVKTMPDLRKWKINDNYDFASHNGAWILGFFAADGYLPNKKGSRNRMVISVARKDEDVLHMIAEELKYNGKIYQYDAYLNGKTFLQSSLAFNSKNLREQMEKYNVVNKKTFKLKELPKELPDEYKIDYIKGFFDGDGSIYCLKDKRVAMNFTCACKSFLEDISDFLSKTYDFRKVNTTGSMKGNNISYQIVYHKYDTLKLGSLFYDNDYLALPRKKKIFFDIRENIIR